MKLRITDTRIKFKPSKKLIDFILTLDEKIMPENILKIIRKVKNNENIEKEILKESISVEKLNDEQIKILNEFQIDENDFIKFENNKNDSINTLETQNINDKEEIITANLNNKKDKKNKNSINKKNDDNESKDEIILLDLNDIKWIQQTANKRRKINPNIEYLHELLENCDLILPENEEIPRNPELEARCQKLKAECEAKTYREMTKNVDTSRKHAPEDTISYQCKL